MFNETKRNYWSTKLKIIDIVWIIKRIRHLIESTKMLFMIIYIDHFVVVFIFKQITLTINNTNKFNLRLIRTFQYFFNFNIFIRYKFDKSNVMSNVFFKLSSKLFSSQNSKNKIDIFDIFYDYFIDLSNYELCFVIIQNMSTITYHVILMKMFDDFKKRFKKIYVENKYWTKILTIIAFKNFHISSNISINETTTFVLFNFSKNEK